MSKRRNSQTEILKQPYAEFNPHGAKTPRAIHTPNDECRPDFRVERMDLNGFWGWKLSPSDLKEYTQNILSWKKLNWMQLRERGCHLIDISTIIPKAQRRLYELGQHDLDQLYSLRLSAKKRIIGIKEHNILWLLWWDPLHSICPSKKKHT